MKQQIALHAEEGLGMVEPETSNNIGQTQWNLCPQWADVEEDPCAEARVEPPYPDPCLSVISPSRIFCYSL